MVRMACLMLLQASGFQGLSSTRICSEIQITSSPHCPASSSKSQTLRPQGKAAAVVAPRGTRTGRWGHCPKSRWPQWSPAFEEGGGFEGCPRVALGLSLPQ